MKVTVMGEDEVDGEGEGESVRVSAMQMSSHQPPLSSSSLTHPQDSIVI